MPSIARGTDDRCPNPAWIEHLSGTRSPEAAIALQAFESSHTDLNTRLQQCSSGKELIGRGFAHDVALAAALNQSQSVPVLRDGAYVNGGIR